MSADVSNLDAYWMPFTANRQFKQAPRLLTSADGMFFRDDKGREVLDGIAGLWCVNAGHNRSKIVKAIQDQAAELDLLKMAIAYHRVRGEGARTRLIGRERGYHGVNFGGISVGGMVANRKMFGSLLAGVDHIRHTHDPARNAFSVGVPEHGAEFADDLERLVALHDASTIAAVIVEPVAGSTGVLIPPQGYLQRLREICDKHGILLIFDEVITGFGRTGNPFGAQTFGVTPDLMTVAKGITNGCVPMGAVFAQQKIHDAFMTGPEHLIEFFHGYTYSAHPLACAAGIATLDTYADDDLLTRAARMQDEFAKALHSLRDEPNVIDVRNIGLVGGIELKPLPGEPAKRAFNIFLDCWDKGLLIRTTGDTIALSPPLIIESGHIARIIDTLRAALRRAA
ncbi:MAG: aspartate aminotransferase family protein [Burkholderiales bacterium]|nr:aspartate aminotransferase family protein [Burkholderiales bacterium]